MIRESKGYFDDNACAVYTPSYIREIWPWTKRPDDPYRPPGIKFLQPQDGYIRFSPPRDFRWAYHPVFKDPRRHDDLDIPDGLSNPRTIYHNPNLDLQNDLGIPAHSFEMDAYQMNTAPVNGAYLIVSTNPKGNTSQGYWAGLEKTCLKIWLFTPPNGLIEKCLKGKPNVQHMIDTARGIYISSYSDTTPQRRTPTFPPGLYRASEDTVETVSGDGYYWWPDLGRTRLSPDHCRFAATFSKKLFDVIVTKNVRLRAIDVCGDWPPRNG